MKVDLGPLVRFVEHLPTNGDVELSVLKCHLLVEEVLTKLIAGNLRHPEYLPNARLGFAQQMWLARASCDLEREAWVWEAVKRLNEARNALAHALDSEKIEKKLEACTSFVEAEQGTPDPEQITQAMGRFHVAAFNVFSLLAARAHVDVSELEIRKRIPTLLTASDEEFQAMIAART